MRSNDQNTKYWTKFSPHLFLGSVLRLPTINGSKGDLRGSTYLFHEENHQPNLRRSSNSSKDVSLHELECQIATVSRTSIYN